MDDDNTVLEKMVRSDYSHPIDDDIFVSRANDEIILCLNYNGLYGLNNIKLLLTPTAKKLPTRATLPVPKMLPTRPVFSPALMPSTL